MTPTREIQRQEELIAILGDFRRARILEILTQQQASVKELAQMIGESPQTTHYHTKYLERVGLIRIVEKREVRGTLEKFYRAVADRFVVTSQVLGQSPEHGMAAWMGIAREWISLGDYYLDDCSPDVSAMWGTVQAVDSDEATMQDFRQVLAEATKRFPACEKKGTAQKYALILGLFPIPSDIAMPEALETLLAVSEEAGKEGVDLKLG